MADRQLPKGVSLNLNDHVVSQTVTTGAAKQRRQDIPPNQRGFPTIRISDPVKARLDAYRGKRSYAEAVGALLDAVEAQPPEPVLVPAPVPWGAVLDAIRSRFGAKGIDYHKLEEALRDAGMPE